MTPDDAKRLEAGRQKLLAEIRETVNDGFDLTNDDGDFLLELLDAQTQREERFREALTWAIGFIRCNLPAGQMYPDFANAEQVLAGKPLYTGPFQTIEAWREEIERLQAAVAALQGRIDQGKRNRRGGLTP